MCGLEISENAAEGQAGSAHKPDYNVILGAFPQLSR
jgi:hypothetical protein